MGRLLITENRVQHLRNFKDYVIFWPDGRRSGPFEFPGVIALTTGEGPDRTLELLQPEHGVTKRRTRERLRDMAIGLAGSLLLTAFLNNVL